MTDVPVSNARRIWFIAAPSAQLIKSEPSMSPPSLVCVVSVSIKFRCVSGNGFRDTQQLLFGLFVEGHKLEF